MKAIIKIATALAYVLLLPLLVFDIVQTAYSWRSTRFAHVAKFCFNAWCYSVKNILSFNN